MNDTKKGLYNHTALFVLERFLQENQAEFEIIRHDTPILSAKDAARYFDYDKAASTLIVDTDLGLCALIVSAKRGRLDFPAMGKHLGYARFKLADRGKAESETGLKVGSVPLAGHGLPCIFDMSLLQYDYIYGGTGDAYHTLKINPRDVLRLNDTVKTIE